jgi:formate hydrogenlyase subunit 4
MEASLISSLLSPLCACVCAPFLFGVIGKTRAFFAGRKGPPLLQAYYDIAKLLRKGAVYSTTASWIFRAGPLVSLAALLTAACIVPLGSLGAPLSFTGDILLFIYLLGIVRFLTVIAALDTGSAFEGMGSSREVFFSALAEPAFLLCLLALSRQADVFSFNAIFAVAPPFTIVPAIMAGVGLFVILLAENARIPVDDPATHLELTMIHEVMVLDHSGPDFAFITYGASIKLWLTGLVVVRTLLPCHSPVPAIDATCTLAAMLALAVLVGIVESIMARLRLLKVPQLLVGAGAIAILALFLGEGALR